MRRKIQDYLRQRSGLGLAIARGIARAHGGDVTLANAPEGGLVATLILPLSRTKGRNPFPGGNAGERIS